jgi:flagellar biosynthesis/type III secretory pathway protein FliH
MTLPRARVVRAEQAGAAKPLLTATLSGAQRTRVSREEMEGRLAAEHLVRDARERADALVVRARDETSAAVDRAHQEAREDADLQLTARWLALRKAEGDSTERNADRVVTAAVVLAERLLGAALELSPERIADLARGVLAEARGARRATIEAHPIDAHVLRAHLPAAGLALHAVELRENEALARGELLLHTDLGTIDAKLASRLDRLAEALRDALR